MARGIFGSFTIRLALIYALLFGASVIGLFAFIYWTTALAAQRQTTATIEAEIRGLADQYRLAGLDGLAGSIRARVAREPLGASLYLLADPRLRPIAGNLDRWPRAPTGADGWIEFRLRDPQEPGDRPSRARARHFVLAGDFHLLVGRDVSEQDDLARRLLVALGWGLGATAVLAFGGAALVRRGVQRKVASITATTRAIMEGDLQRRVPRGGGGDEFDELAGHVNAMLERIDALFQGVRQVSDNIAHDLRGPLTRLRARLELAQMTPPDAPGQRALIDATLIEVDQLLATFGAALRIAEIEAGAARRRFQPVDLAALARDAIEIYEPVAHERRQSLTAAIEAEASINGDRDLLAQALANLIDNAVKYAPEGGRVVVRVARAGPEATLEVVDNGPGVPEAERDKVLQRFYRLERNRSSPGSGLGLSLVAAVARLHGARLVLGDGGPGLRVSVIFIVR